MQIHNDWRPTKIARHIKKKKYTLHNEKKVSIETDSEITSVEQS